MAFYNWSKTAASNSNADSTINWQEGQAPSSVNDSARAQMARTAEWRDDISGTITTAGTSTAYTLASNQVFDTLAHMNGAMIAFIPHTNSGATVTLNVDGLGAKPLRSSPAVELVANQLVQGAPYVATYNNSDGAFYLQNATGLPPQQATNTLLGNVSGSTARPSAVTIGGGLLVTGTTLSAPAVPVAAAFKNLVIKVASNTTATLTADFIVVTDGTNYQTLAFNQTINLGTTGANALDAGTIAIDTWYYIWAIAKSDGTVAGLASTSATAPTMPSGYTYKARVGAIQTVHATATLYGTWQFGRRARYVVGLAQTSVLPVMASGGATSWTAISTTRFVPTTASSIAVSAGMTGNASLISQMNVAPNSSYATSGLGGVLSLATPANATACMTGDILLESTNIYHGEGGSPAAVNLACYGWEDNI